MDAGRQARDVGADDEDGGSLAHAGTVVPPRSGGLRRVCVRPAGSSHHAARTTQERVEGQEQHGAHPDRDEDRRQEEDEGSVPKGATDDGVEHGVLAASSGARGCVIFPE